MFKDIKFILAHVKTGRRISDKVKITIICILRFLKERLPS